MGDRPRLAPPVRAAAPGDYDAIAAVLDEWWGRPVLSALPRLFFDLFHRTSLVIDPPLPSAGQAPSVGPVPSAAPVPSAGRVPSADPVPLVGLAGLVAPWAFLVGILSPSDPRQAYIHFAGVAPAARGRGLGRVLYEAFFALARSDGRQEVSAITSAGNTGSAEFHRSMGFAVTGPVAGYNGPGRDRVVFRRPL